MPKLVLNSVIRPIGLTQGAWRHPDATPQRVLDLSYYQEYARISADGRGCTEIRPGAMELFGQGVVFDHGESKQ